MNRASATDWMFPAATIAAPIAAATLFAAHVGLFLPGRSEVEALALSGLSAEARGAADLRGRMTYAVGALLVIAAGLAGTGWAIWRMRRAAGGGFALLALLFAVAFGAGSLSMNASMCRLELLPLHDLTCALNVGGGEERTGLRMRHIAVDHVFAQIGEPAGHDDVLALTAAATLPAVLAVATLAVLLALLAAPLPGARDLAGLRRRRADIQRALLFGALILTLSLAATRSFYLWPLGMLDEASAAIWSGPVSAATAYWGLFYSLILVAAVAPPALALDRDIARFADGARIDPEARPGWLRRTGLILAPREAVVSALAAAAPMLSGPVMDLVGALG